MEWKDDFGEDLGRLRGSSRVFYSASDARTPSRDSDAVKDVVSQLALGPKTKKELAEKLGITENAVCKRIFRARKAGYVIGLSSGLYNLKSNERTCKKCGKRLAKLNRGDCCYNCESNG